ncbi:amino acid adenylation domain-containing protein [Rheinheimera baltica]|uniref:Amino acid adenylation domain-containing protein n=1 Tax=Rheinheimera baltica TaxID=67576 RepID=A0ABT9HUS2_9GAMM|nr:amino acid adenylation domain-containing protein [Rheinheimera baltica]MDP5134763.1 amino acid adenylation domain-containing protein [Rheinheimera baltica]
MERYNAKKLLVKLNALGIKLWVEQDTLRFLAPSNTFSVPLREQVKKVKVDLITELRAGAEQFHPVSSAQKRIWLGERYSPDLSAYNVPILWYVKGQLDEPQLARTIQLVAEQNDVFCQSFHFRYGELASQFKTGCQLPLTQHDWRKPVDLEPNTLTDEQKLTEISRLAMVFEPFDLTSAPLCRADYFRLSEATGALLIVFHHLIIDEFSATSFTRQLRSCFTGNKGGEVSPQFSYQEYVVQQKAVENSPAYSDALKYYRHQLGEALIPVSLPYKKKQQPLNIETDSITVNLSAEQSIQITTLLAEQRITDFVYFLSVFMVLLRQSKKEKCIQVTTPVSCIPECLDGEAMGLFQNIAIIGAQLSPQTLFSELLKQVKRNVSLALDNRHLVFEDVLASNQSGLGSSPQLLFLKQTAQKEQLSIGDATFEPVWFGGGAGKSDLLVGFTHHDDRFVVNFEFKMGCFDRLTIEKFARRYHTLLITAFGAINRQIAEFEPLQQLIARSAPVLANEQSIGRTQEEFVSVTSHVDALALKHPDKCAVDADSCLTYQQLKEQSDRVARALQQRGISPGNMLGLCMRRSCSLVVSLLGILKAGAGYVPLDDTLPKERLKALCRNAKITAVICSEYELDKLQQVEIRPMLINDLLNSDQITAASHLVPPLPGLTAYAIYTSGSTGEPKGVCVSHRALVSFLSWCREWFSKVGFESLYGATPISFDVSVFEIFASLYCEGTVRFIQAYSDLPERSTTKLTITAVPSVLKQYLYGHELTPAVDTVYLAGEAVDAKLVELIKQRSNITKVFNLYGPTESLVYATGYAWPDLTLSHCIGRVRTDLQSYIVDDDLNLVAENQIGQLALAGTGIADGYLHMAIETASRFVPNPFSNHAGSRMYLTGDLVRLTLAGNLEYLGRLDGQLKVNGVRIEPQEIESILNQDVDVDFAFVGTREIKGRRLLVAALKLAQVSEGVMGRLRRHCLTHLPSYLVPHVFLQILDIPLNSNGKVDRQKLQELLDKREAVTYRINAAARYEQQIAQLWKQVLCVEEISFNDNFFEAGGGSMQLLELKELLEQTFNLSIPIIDIFASPTARDMAELISLRLAGEVDVVDEKKVHRGGKQRQAIGRIGQLIRRGMHE